MADEIKHFFPQIKKNFFNSLKKGFKKDYKNTGIGDLIESTFLYYYVKGYLHAQEEVKKKGGKKQ